MWGVMKLGQPSDPNPVLVPWAQDRVPRPHEGVLGPCRVLGPQITPPPMPPSWSLCPQGTLQPQAHGKR